MICTEPSFDTVARFNELPNLWDADEAKNEQVTEETFKTLGHLFVAYHVERIFGLTLLHNHFSLEEGEILLETGSLFDSQQEIVSQPVKVDKLASPAQGFNWRIINNSYVPYEFRPKNKDLKIEFSSPDIQSFLEEFSQKLNELDLTRIFGICTINEEDFIKPGIEYTNGRKNITIPLADSTDIFDKVIEALWIFKSDSNEKIIQRGCQRVCSKSCGIRGRNHAKLHSPSHSKT
ncbi:hypothetical protein RhiirA5_436574 [Rhizophagus irregularis]|uniref:Uncharacterized protein n=3 Tax=Rhizophagus irregularis TaxID=588596 RepID=A0A2N0NLR5_9GLOM|nr:hypothetical protein GLOIN_2v1750093 [Rhizophagus irregularis DAOM 181602=DAOM 197198]EXX77201.1 hypothetical protein RirG_025980 [Rhizophagus irregularis DAOM 197198w]PKB95512.1 hypothetical protein RhiirA5_436574 [Rhizophagus irregularis]POG73652.1 hypothetical protein GLOIN_2v1750093 [Rhizophagus irregularis DAOM 181602=DAOM 197198]UZO06371.1 hypothetical protein OCT59_026696 [Rhizophagus irregularis]CAB4494475.1 unnamed protein product [Rhizophagus irregularis]|eukprot:XP_025180518.1 hypothetical protein GLOIN_2v1750093 [Rhizophagus irregularis DAOM 181602=DAOM 197198]